MLMIFSSHRITRQKRLIPEAKALMGDYHKEILSSYYEIFNENSKSQRINFFKDPLVQFLWSSFSEKHADSILPEADTDPEKRQVFMKEIMDMEKITDFQILPVQQSRTIWFEKKDTHQEKSMIRLN